MSAYESQLVVLVADRSMRSTVEGLLSRPEALGIPPVRWDCYVHPERDPGCLLRGHEFVRPMCRRYAHCLLMFDRTGCGREEERRGKIEETVEEELSRSGWSGRAAVVVLDPELEVWVWSDSPEVDTCLGWGSQGADLRAWLREKCLWPQDAAKPTDPKAAVEAALREVRKPRSSAIYERLARRVSFERCGDPAFLKLKEILRGWFGTWKTPP